MTPTDNQFPSTVRKPPSGSPNRIGPPSSRPSGFPIRNPPSSNCRASMPGTGRSRTPFAPQARPQPRPKSRFHRSPRSACQFPDVSRKKNHLLGEVKTKWYFCCERPALCLNENKRKKNLINKNRNLRLLIYFFQDVGA